MKRFGRGPLDDFWYHPVGPTASSGETVSPGTALTLSAYWACIVNTSEDLAKLPLPVYRRMKRGRELVFDHAVSQLLNVEFNSDTTAFIGRQTLSQWAKAWGNGYAEIQRNGVRRPTALNPIHPSRVTVKRNDSNRLYYEVRSNDGISQIQPANMFHLVGRISDDGICGVSVAAAGCESIGRALAVQKYGAALFAGGGADRVALVHPGKLGKEEAAANIRRSWKELYGGADNQGPAVLQEGMKLERVGIPPEQAQMLEAMQFTVEDLARWFRCPPSKIGHFLRAQGWSTLETLNTDYVIDTLMPESIRWEQEIRRKLLMQTETDLYAKHNFNALMRGDSAARAEFYSKMFRLGILNRDEIRELEELNPVDGGDTYYIEGSNLQAIRSGTDEDETQAAYRRDVVKALLSKADAGMLVTNAESAGELAEETGLPAGIIEEREEVDPVEPLPPAMPDEEPPMPMPDEPAMAAAMEAARFALDHEFHRALRKEIKTVEGIVRKTLAKGDDTGFKQRVEEFYGDWSTELADTLKPVASVLDALGHGVNLAERCGRHAVSSRAQLLAVMRDDGRDGVVNRLDEWETSRRLCDDEN